MFPSTHENCQQHIQETTAKEYKRNIAKTLLCHTESHKTILWPPKEKYCSTLQIIHGHNRLATHLHRSSIYPHTSHCIRIQIMQCMGIIYYNVKTYLKSMQIHIQNCDDRNGSWPNSLSTSNDLTNIMTNLLNFVAHPL